MENMILVVGIGVFVAMVLGFIYMIDEDLFYKVTNWVKKPVKDFVDKVRDPEKRKNMMLEENYILWLTWSFFGLVLGIWFYIAGFGAAMLIKGLNYFGLRKVEADKKSESEEDEEERNSLDLWDDFKNATIGFVKRAFNAEERAKFDVDEYIMFMMITTIPFSITFKNFGLFAYLLAIVVLVAIVVIQKVTGYKFTNVKDMKEKLSKDLLAEKEQEIAELKAQVAKFEETMEMSIDGITKKIEEENSSLKTQLEKVTKAFEDLKKRVLYISEMKKWKNEVKPALEELKDELKSRTGDEFEVK